MPAILATWEDIGKIMVPSKPEKIATPYLKNKL
jgi:hypothetical protein